jgi:hypothetical protein
MIGNMKCPDFSEDVVAYPSQKETESLTAFGATLAWQILYPKRPTRSNTGY